MAQDSPLSIAASVIGILTFAVAILLGVYARTIQLNQIINSLNRADDEIREMIERTVQFVEEIEKLRKDVLDPGNTKDDGELFATFTRVCCLLLQNQILLGGFISQPTAILSRWEAQRNELGRNIVAIEGLQSKIYNIQLLLISK